MSESYLKKRSTSNLHMLSLQLSFDKNIKHMPSLQTHSNNLYKHMLSLHSKKSCKHKTLSICRPSKHTRIIYISICCPSIRKNLISICRPSTWPPSPKNVYVKTCTQCKHVTKLMLSLHRRTRFTRLYFRICISCPSFPVPVIIISVRVM